MGSRPECGKVLHLACGERVTSMVPSEERREERTFATTKLTLTKLEGNGPVESAASRAIKNKH